MQLVLASHNAGKLGELQAMLAPLHIELLLQSQLGIAPAPEPHRTFIENALAKARHAAAQSGLPALADDAGLCVDAWQGQPGVDTADFCTRFGYPKSDDHNVQALLEQMQMQALVLPHQRRAAMVSTLVAVRRADDPEPLVAVGRVRVEIAPERRGEGGFGFDPVLVLPAMGQTFAQLPREVKNAHSHRGLAVAQMLALLRAHWLSA